MRTLAVASLALLIATPASAQQWTQEQQELIDHIEMCWDAWVEALADETPDHFFESCKQDENTLVWWTPEGAPQDIEWVYRNWQRVREVDVDWADMRPVAVNILGDVGIVYLYGYWIASTADGPVTTEYKRTEVFQRRNGEWVFLGLQGTPSTPADAEPYK
jgi:hypothetical protein